MQTQETLRQELERHQRYLSFLVMAGDLFSRSMRLEETLEAVCDAAVGSVADICLVDVTTPDGGVRLAAYAHRIRAREPELAGAERNLESAPGRPAHPVAAVIASGEPYVARLIDEDYIERSAASDAHAAHLRRFGYRSLIVVPLVSVTAGTLGALTLAITTASDETFDELTVSFARDLGQRCGQAIAKARLYEQHLRIATRFQTAALPARLPTSPFATFDAYYEPSSEDLLVGGDWYDAFMLPDGRFAITIGDVLGHGLDAAVWMSRLRNALRAAMFGEPDCRGALAIAEAVLTAESTDLFTTAIVAIVDADSCTLTCASAGHPGPLVWDERNGVADPFAERGAPLGLAAFGAGPAPLETVSLRPGAFVVFFTDGLLEWKRDIAATWETMTAAVASREVREAPSPALALRDAVIGSGRHFDDIAILTLRCSEG